MQSRGRYEWRLEASARVSQMHHFAEEVPCVWGASVRSARNTDAFTCAWMFRWCSTLESRPTMTSTTECLLSAQAARRAPPRPCLSVTL